VDELLDLPLRLVSGSSQEGIRIHRSEVRRQLGDAGEVETTVGQHFQEEGMLEGRAGRGDAQVGLGLGEVKDLRAVGEHGGGGFAGVEPALVHLGDVGQEVGLRAAGLLEQIGQPTKQLVVGD